MVIPATPRRSVAELLLVVAAKVLSVAAMFLCSMLAARHLGAAAYGHFATALALLTLLDGLLGSPLDLAAIRFGTLHATEPLRVATMQSFLLRAKLLFAALLLVLAWPAAGLIASLVMPGADASLVLLLLGSLVVMLVLRGYAVQLQLARRFRAYATLDTAQGLLRIAGAIGVWTLWTQAGAASWLLVYGLAAGVALAVAAIAFPQPLWAGRSPPPDDLRALAVYVSSTAGIVALGTLSGRADVPLVSAALGAAAAGLYSAGTQLAVAGTMLATYIGIVTQPRILGWTQSGQLSRLVTLNVLVGAAMAGVLLLLPSALVLALVVQLFGPDFAAALPVVKVLLLGTCFDFAIMPLLLPYALQLESRHCLRGETLLTAIFVGGMLWALARDITSVAWVVTGIRFLKLCFYGWIFAHTRDRHRGGNPG